MQVAIRHLHLAFKGMETDEIYDVLMAQLIRAVAKYDPAYTEKVKLVVEAINEKLSQCEQLCLADVGRHVGFDCHRYMRLLCRRGYLTSAMGENRRISGYVRSKIWPPPEFFSAGAIGVAYSYKPGSDTTFSSGSKPTCPSSKPTKGSIAGILHVVTSPLGNAFEERIQTAASCAAKTLKKLFPPIFWTI
jgi:hypothetical protein